MDKERSLTLLAGGVEQWNIWAKRRQSEREHLRQRGLWIEGANDWNDETKHWHEETDIEMPGDRFANPIDYSGYIFPGGVLLSQATFADRASFSRAIFEGDVQFASASFQGGVDFSGATFCGAANFHLANMSASAIFSEARFHQEANFLKSTFKKGARFDNTDFSGRVIFEGVQLVGPANFRHSSIAGILTLKSAVITGAASFVGARFGRAVDFDGVSISGLANFEDATFEDVAQFGSGTFEGGARFKGVEFLMDGPAGGAWFSNVVFGKDARFDKVVFSGGAVFSAATFSTNAWFSDARFVGGADFLRAEFKGFTSFDRAEFSGEASFRAIDARSVFSLASTIFRRVPDFIQAHFVEAPRLDNSCIEHEKRQKMVERDGKEVVRRDPDLAARWRNLKRLAILGHDHAREQAFFKGEIEARRGTEDRFWHGAFLFGVLYGLLSDFGRSLWRPLFWWLGSVFAFAGWYLSQHPEIVNGKLSMRSALLGFLGIAPEESRLECVFGSGNPGLAAFLLSLQKGLLVFGTVPAKKVDQLNACLYGIHAAGDGRLTQLPETFSPVVPDSVALVGLGQYPLSAILIFLLLLSVRNHFRIK